MNYGAITGYFDVAQVTLYVFWLFFAGLIIYLRREDQREGYPLVYHGMTKKTADDFPAMPKPKVFLLSRGRQVLAPRFEAPQQIAAEPGPFLGAPIQPTGNPMIDGLGPAAWANRADEPDETFDEGLPKIVPLRVAPDFSLAEEDADPIGMEVLGADGQVAGTIVDAWIDRSEVILRYLEIARSGAGGTGNVLLPMPFADIKAKKRQIKVSALLASQFANVPTLRKPDLVTLLEEDKICGYYGGGTLFATPERAEPFL